MLNRLIDKLQHGGKAAAGGLPRPRSRVLETLAADAAAEMAEAGGPRDPTLVRHSYDLYIIRNHYNVAEVAALAQAIIPHDAEIFGNQFPAYRADPIAVTRHAVEALATDQRRGVAPLK